jgi:hypothetical protein
MSAAYIKRKVYLLKIIGQNAKASNSGTVTFRGREYKGRARVGTL